MGSLQPLSGQIASEVEAEQLMRKGKLVIQSRNCMNCPIFFSNGAYFSGSARPSTG